MTIKIIYITQSGDKKVAITTGAMTNTEALQAKIAACKRVLSITQSAHYENN
jgi:hypothetical protein